MTALLIDVATQEIVRTYRMGHFARWWHCVLNLEDSIALAQVAALSYTLPQNPFRAGREAAQSEECSCLPCAGACVRIALSETCGTVS